MKVKVAWLLETGFQSPQLFALGQLFSHTPPAPHPPCQLQEVTDDAEGLQRSWSFLLSPEGLGVGEPQERLSDARAHPG